jgi:hypothetical protein
VNGFTTWIIDAFKNMMMRFTIFEFLTASMTIIIIELPKDYHDKYGTITAVKKALIPLLVLSSMTLGRVSLKKLQKSCRQITFNQ